MKTIKQIYKIKAPVEEVWKALVDPEVISKWGGGPAKMDDKLGTKFKLWGGDIHGKNIKVEENKELRQEWYNGSWNKPSAVTFSLKETNEGTELHLLHTEVPDEEEKEIAGGWESYYLGPLKKFLEKN